MLPVTSASVTRVVYSARARKERSHDVVLDLGDRCNHILLQCTLCPCIFVEFFCRLSMRQRSYIRAIAVAICLVSTDSMSYPWLHTCEATSLFGLMQFGLF